MRVRSDAGIGLEAQGPVVAPAEEASAEPSSVIAALLPLMGVVLVGFCLIGAAMPVLPLHVHDGLGFGPVTLHNSRLWVSAHKQTSAICASNCKISLVRHDLQLARSSYLTSNVSTQAFA